MATHGQGAPRRRSGWRRFVLWSAAGLCILPILLASAVLFYAEHADRGRLRSLLVEQVNRRIAGEIEIDSLQFTLTGTLVMDGIRLLAPPPFRHREVLSIGRLEVRWWLPAIMNRTVDLDRIVAEKMAVVLETLPDGRMGFAEAVAARDRPASPPPESAPEKKGGLPELPVRFRISSLDIHDGSIAVYSPSSETRIGLFSAALGGELAGGRLTAQVKIVPAGEGRLRVVFLGNGVLVETELGGHLLSQFDSANPSAPGISAELATAGLDIRRDGKSLPLGEASLALRNAETPGWYDFRFRLGEILEGRAQFRLPEGERGLGIDGGLTARFDPLRPAAEALGTSLSVRGGELAAPVVKGEIRFKPLAVSVEKLELSGRADRIARENLVVEGLTGRISSKRFEWQGPGDRHPQGIFQSGEAGSVNAEIQMASATNGPELSIAGIRTSLVAGAPKGVVQGTLSATVADILVAEAGDPAPRFRGGLDASVAFSADAALETVTADPVRLELLRARVTVPQLLALDLPLVFRSRAVFSGLARSLTVEAAQFGVADWLTVRGSGRVSAAAPSPFAATVSAEMDLGRLGRAIEPVQEKHSGLDSLAGEVRVEGSASGSIMPFQSDFQSEASIRLSMPDPDGNLAVGRLEGSGELSGRMGAGAMVERLLGKIGWHAYQVRYGRNRAGELGTTISFTPESQPGLIRTAVEFWAREVIIDALGSDAAPDISFWLRMVADPGRRRVRELSAPFTLKDTLNGRIEGEADLSGQRPRLDIRTRIDPFSVANLVRRMPETIRQTAARYRPQGTGTADIRAVGQLPGPDVMVTGELPIRLEGIASLTDISAVMGDTTVRGGTGHLVFRNGNERQELDARIAAKEILTPGAEKVLEDTEAEARLSYANLNQIELDRFTVAQPVAGFSAEGTGNFEQLLSKPRAGFRISYGLQVEDAAMTAGRGLSGSGRVSGNLRINLHSLKEAELAGSADMDNVSVRMGERLQVREINGPVTAVLIARMGPDGLVIQPVREHGVPPEALSILERRLSWIDPGGKPLRFKEALYGTARVDDFSAVVTVDGDVIRCRQMEARLLEGVLIAELEMHYYPATSLWLEGSMSRLNTETLMVGRSSFQVMSGDYLVNQNVSLRLAPGGGVDARINVTRIGKEALDGLLDLMDPERTDPQMKNIREKLGIGLVPYYVFMRAEHGYLNMIVALKPRLITRNIGDFFTSAAIRLLLPVLGRTVLKLEQHINRIPLAVIMDNLRRKQGTQ